MNLDCDKHLLNTKSSLLHSHNIYKRHERNVIIAHFSAVIAGCRAQFISNTEIILMT